MVRIPITCQLMDPNCKLVQVCAYTVTGSVEQQLQQHRKIIRLADIRVIFEDSSSEGSSAFKAFAFLRKKESERKERLLIR
jgi:hypothetical protein